MPLSCGGCNRRGRYLRLDEPPQDIFDGEAVAKPLILRFDGACGADGEAVVYFSVFLMNSNEHRMKFLPRTETCGITCPYEVRFACFFSQGRNIIGWACLNISAAITLEVGLFLGGGHLCHKARAEWGLAAEGWHNEHVEAGARDGALPCP
jgi:hypothetical protein